MSSYRELQSTYSALEAQNTALREELHETDSDWKETLETLNMYEALNNRFWEEIKSLQAQRDLLLEGVDMLASVHHAECHDDRLWCAECCYAFPCPSYEIAFHCSAKIDEFEHM